MDAQFAAPHGPRAPALLGVMLGLLHAQAAGAATVDWVSFAGYTPLSLSQSGFTSPDGLVVDVAFSNVTGFAASAPVALAAILDDPAWPFTNSDVALLVITGPGGGSDISTQMTLSFSNPGGLPAGGSVAIADLETAGTSVTISGFANDAPVSVNWALANYEVTGSNVPSPTWNPATGVFSAPGVPGFGGVNSFAFLTSDVPLDEIRLAIIGAGGDGVAVGVTSNSVAVVPGPPAVLLLATSLAGLAVRRRYLRAIG